MRPALAAIALLFLTFAAQACSVRRYAITKLGDALASSGTTFASDNDPDLVRDAVPFSLKLIESLLAETPRHEGLLLAASKGFAQYAYAFVQQEADEWEDKDLARSRTLRDRARKLYLRSRDYGLRGFEVRHRDFARALRADPRAAVRQAVKRDVPLLYWTAAAWGSAISVSKDNPDLVADVPQVEALIDRALELDEAYEGGSIHSFLVTYEMSRQGAAGDPAERSRRHLERALALSKGLDASPLVAYAESVLVSQQQRKEFEALLGRALAIDVDAWPENRLVNLIMQRRARWLLGRIDELFLE